MSYASGRRLAPSGVFQAGVWRRGGGWWMETRTAGNFLLGSNRRLAASCAPGQRLAAAVRRFQAGVWRRLGAAVRRVRRRRLAPSGTAVRRPASGTAVRDVLRPVRGPSGAVLGPPSGVRRPPSGTSGAVRGAVRRPSGAVRRRRPPSGAAVRRRLRTVRCVGAPPQPKRTTFQKR